MIASKTLPDHHTLPSHAERSCIEPLQLITILENSPVRLAPVAIILLFRVDAVQLRRLVTARNEDTELDEGAAGRWQLKFGEKVNPIGGLTDADAGNVLCGEVGQLVVGEAVDGSEVLGFMLYAGVKMTNEVRCNAILSRERGTYSDAPCACGRAPSSAPGG